MSRKTLLLLGILMLSVGMLLAGCGGDSSGASEESAGNNATENNAAENSGEESNGAQDEEQFAFNLGHTLAPDNHYHMMATKLAELVEEKTNGSITIDVFPQSQLGGEVQMIQAAQAGSQEMLITAQAPLTNMVPEWSIFDLPYLFDDVEQANEVLASEAGDQFLEMLPDHDLIGLGWLSAMERSVFASSPIESVDDFSGFKVRVMEAPGYVEAYESLGAQPTPMAYSEVYTALQQGVVDGADTSPDQFVQDGFNEVAGYYNRTKVHHLPAVLLISKDIWEQLSADQQNALSEAAEEALAYGIDYYYQSFDESIEQMKSEGIEVVESDVDSIKEVTDGVYDSLLADIPNGEALLQSIEEAKK